MSGTDTPELRMVSEIARQFADEPDAESAAKITAHLRKFWAPALIDALIDDADGGAGLDPVVATVVESLR